jgi:16S rRNA processing protein RimM
LADSPILLGVIGRAHGVRGLVRVTSHTADPTALTAYGPLSDSAGRQFALRWMGEGIAEISELVGGKPLKVADRSGAERLTNVSLFIERDRLPAPEPDEYYLTDLIGIAAVAADGTPLGVVIALHDYGAGVSVEISRERAGSLLVPFTTACVPEVNIAAGRMIVTPPAEIDAPETDVREAADQHKAPRSTRSRSDRHDTKASPSGAGDRKQAA